MSLGNWQLGSVRDALPLGCEVCYEHQCAHQGRYYSKGCDLSISRITGIDRATSLVHKGTAAVIESSAGPRMRNSIGQANNQKQASETEKGYGSNKVSCHLNTAVISCYFGFMLTSFSMVRNFDFS